MRFVTIPLYKTKLMQEVYKPEYQYTYEIYLESVLLESTELDSSVNMTGYYKEAFDNRFHPINYVSDYRIFERMLQLSIRGYEIMEKIKALMENSIEPKPRELCLKSEDGKPFYLDKLIFKVYRPKEKCHDGNWRDQFLDNFYILENIETTQEYYDQYPDQDDWMMLNLDLEEAKSMQNHLLDMLSKWYRGFLLMNDSGIPIGKAKKMNHLQNELLYDLARNTYIIKELSK